MSITEQVEEHARGARVTLIVPSPDCLHPIDWEGKRFVIDTETALYHADRVCALDARTMPDASLVLGKGVWFAEWRKFARGPRALIGRIDLHHKLCALGAPVVHRHPEDGLHPAQAVELGDLFLRWTTERDS
jgi:hypothetical protein